MTDKFSKPNLTGPRLGRRVSVRSRIRYSGGSSAVAGPSFTDTVGELVRRTEDHLVVRTRSGEERHLANVDVVALKEVPPRAQRPGPAHRVIGVHDLQRLGLDGLPPLHREPLGEWVLRAAGGYTGRANSALAIGDPGLPPPDALSAVQRFYDRQSLPALLQLVDGPDGDGELTDAISGAGWHRFQPTLAMTAPAAAVAAGVRSPDPRIPVTDQVDDAWFAGATDREQRNRGVLEEMLSAVPHGRFAVRTDDAGVPIAVGRSSLSPGWAGVFAVHVRADLRGAGLGRAMMEALALDALTHGAASMYLQVSADNLPAVSLYRSLGFEVHHTYCYAQAPA